MLFWVEGATPRRHKRSVFEPGRLKAAYSLEAAQVGCCLGEM